MQRLLVRPWTNLIGWVEKPFCRNTASAPRGLTLSVATESITIRKLSLAPHTDINIR